MIGDRRKQGEDDGGAGVQAPRRDRQRSFGDAAVARPEGMSLSSLAQSRPDSLDPLSGNSFHHRRSWIAKLPGGRPRS